MLVLTDPYVLVSLCPLQGTYNAAYIPRTQMSNCIRPGVSATVSTAATAALAGVLSCTIEETFALPFSCLSRASTSLRIDCDGVRWSGVVCFCRPIAVYSGSTDSSERPNEIRILGGVGTSLYIRGDWKGVDPWALKWSLKKNR